MALSGLDIYKLLKKTNCRECGFATCLAFAMSLAKKTTSIDKCPYLSPEAKIALEASSLPPIKLVTIGSGENKLESGNETVMFRHEEKFYRPTGIGFIIPDNLSGPEIKKRLDSINSLKFERVGQLLEVNLIAVKQTGGAGRFVETVKTVMNGSSLPLALMSEEAQALKQALEATKGRNPLIYRASKDNISWIAQLAKEFKAPLAVFAPDLAGLCALTQELNRQGVFDLFLDTGKKNISEKIRDLTQIRRQALKKSNRALGYPVMTVVENSDAYEETVEAAAYIAKYAGLVLLSGFEPWQVLSLLTLRQNIYTDPQKPLQIESKLYAIGAASKKSPVLITTNFSLTYFTVLGEVEASKVPSYILPVDTEGMSVLTAWAAEKFTPDKISDSLNKFGVKDAASQGNLVIPGYVAVMSGELEEASGWKVLVGPKEAAGLPSFLKNLQ